MIKKHFLLLLIFVFTQLDSSTVICLQGTSRSGKSSLCEEMENYSSWSILGGLYPPYLSETLSVDFPKEFELIESGIDFDNLRHALAKNMYIFKNQISDEEKEQVLDSIQLIRGYYSNIDVYKEHMRKFSDVSLEKIIMELREIPYVLADMSWYVRPEHIRSIAPETDVKTVLLYCPFEKVIDRLISKNEECLRQKNLKNYRFFYEPIKSFNFLYTLTKEEAGHIDRIEKNQLLNIYKKIEAQLVDDSRQGENGGFMLHEISKSEIIKMREMIESEFENEFFIYIRPKIEYDMLLRTDRTTITECGEILNNYVQSADI